MLLKRQRTKEMKYLTTNIVKGMKNIIKFLRLSKSGKIKDDNQLEFTEQMINHISDISNLCNEFGSNHKQVEILNKEIERLYKKFPKNYFKKQSSHVEEGYEDYEADFDEMVGEDEEYEENQNPREKPFNFTQAKKAQIVKDCIHAMEEEDLDNRNDATRFMYDWLKDNDYVVKGISAPIGILGPLFTYIEENYEE